MMRDGQAYVFLAKHGPLLRQLKDKSVLLTVEGRVWVLTFLLREKYLSKELFNALATYYEQAPSLAAFQTGNKIKQACERWLTENEYNLQQHGQDTIAFTDLSYRQAAFLMGLLVAAQENLERAALERTA